MQRRHEKRETEYCGQGGEFSACAQLVKCCLSDVFFGVRTRCVSNWCIVAALCWPSVEQLASAKLFLFHVRCRVIWCRVICQLMSWLSAVRAPGTY